jgi:hypothetical protein
MHTLNPKLLREKTLIRKIETTRHTMSQKLKLDAFINSKHKS